MNKNKALCRTCFKKQSEYGPTPRKKPKTCEGCRKPGQLHRDSDWLWNMLVTRKPRKGKKKFKILWSKETLRDQLWWLKPRKRVKQEVKEEVKAEVMAEPGVAANNKSSSSLSSSSLSSSAPSASAPSSPAAAPRAQLDVLVKIEPDVENGGREMQ
jgi:hypothetical protein